MNRHFIVRFYDFVDRQLVKLLRSGMRMSATLTTRDILNKGAAYLKPFENGHDPFDIFPVLSFI
jgi:hypothetical protein